jgi:hypothetical protein
VADTLATHVACRQAAQFRVDERQQAVERGHLTAPPSLQQSSGVVLATGNPPILYPPAPGVRVLNIALSAGFRRF